MAGMMDKPLDGAGLETVAQIFAERFGIPAGIVVMWSGAADNIPSGWVLCDGTNGTPDLRNRFIVGAGSTYAVGATGGSDTVKLTVSQMPSHKHTMNAASGTEDPFKSYYVPKGNDMGGGTFSTNAAGSSAAHENRPPYYALCYIMKAATE